MATVRLKQQRFTQGEIDPKMLGRTDIDQYYGAAGRALNVLALPQGGLKRRPGLEHIDGVLFQISRLTSATITTVNGGTGANANDDNTSTTLTTTTNMGTTNPYVVASYDFTLAKDIGVVYINGLSISAGSATYYVQVSSDGSTWKSVSDAIPVTTTPRDFSRHIFGHYRYIRLARVGSSDLGTAKTSVKDFLVYQESAISETRAIEFEFNVDQTYKMAFSDQNVSIYQGATHLIDVRIPALTSDKLPEMDFITSGDTMLIFHEDLQTIKLQRQGGNDIWGVSTVQYLDIPTHDFGVVTPAGTMTASAVGPAASATITASSSVFTAGMVGWVVRGNDGYARIIGYTSGTSVTVEIIDNFTNTSAFSDWTLEEPVWSAARGWPRHGCFHQGRTVLDGGKSRPSIFYMGYVNDTFNFDFGTGLDDEAIGPLGGGDLNEITGFYSGRNLMIFTTGGEYIMPQNFGDPITPTNAAVLRQSSIGSQRYLRPLEVDGGVLYMQKGGRSVQEFLFDSAQEAYDSNIASLLSSHLINAPIDFGLRRSASTDEGAFIMIPLEDGSCTIATFSRKQGIRAFTPHTTDGYFKNAAADVEDMFFIVERTIAGKTRRYLERFNEDCYLDASVIVTSGLPTATFANLDHLNGKTCRVRADGAIMTDRVISGGTVTIERNVASSFEIGLPYTPIVQDLPPEVPQLGTIDGLPVNLSEIILRLHETSGIKVNGKPFSFRKFGPAGNGSPLDAPPPIFTGTIRKKGWIGWGTNRGQVSITQDDPMPMTVLSISKRLKV